MTVHILDQILKTWGKANPNEHATNALRQLVCQGLKCHSKADIARYLRTRLRVKGMKLFNGIAKRDREWDTIYRWIGRFEAAKKSGKLAHIILRCQHR